MAAPAEESRAGTRDLRPILSPIPGLPARRRRILRHALAVVALGLYAGAAWTGYRIVDSALSSGDRIVSAAPVAPPVASRATAQDVLATRVLAARAQRSVFVVEAAGGGQGSGFVAWTRNGESYLVTAYGVVAGVLADGGRTVFVRRGGTVWTGRIFRADRERGLVLVRLPGTPAEPLWQSLRHAKLARGDAAVVVRAGAANGLGEGTVARVGAQRLAVDAGANPLGVGAPVVAADGRLAGVVTATNGRTHRIVPIDRACVVIRRCG